MDEFCEFLKIVRFSIKGRRQPACLVHELIILHICQRYREAISLQHAIYIFFDCENLYPYENSAPMKVPSGADHSLALPSSYATDVQAFLSRLVSWIMD